MRKLGFITLLVLVCGVVGIIAATADAEETSTPTETPPSAASVGELAPNVVSEECPVGHACAWNWTGTRGVRGESLCTGGNHEMGNLKASGKNECRNKAIWLKEGTVGGVCVEPGYGAPNIEFSIIWVAPDYTHC